MKNDLRIRALSAQGTRSSPQGHVDTPDGGNLGSWGLRAVELNPPPKQWRLGPGLGGFAMRRMSDIPTAV